MEIKTFKETYHSPVKQINVPTPFQMGNFDVIFMQKIPEKNEQSKPKRTPNPLLKGSVKVIDDKTPLENDWELD